MRSLRYVALLQALLTAISSQPMTSETSQAGYPQTSLLHQDVSRRVVSPDSSGRGAFCRRGCRIRGRFDTKGTPVNKTDK